MKQNHSKFPNFLFLIFTNGQHNFLWKPINNDGKRFYWYVTLHVWEEMLFQLNLYSCFTDLLSSLDLLVNYVALVEHSPCYHTLKSDDESSLVAIDLFLTFAIQN